GPHARCDHTREVVLKLAAAAPEAAILNLLAREIFPAATAMSQGLTGVAGGRPSPSPLIRGGAFLIARDQLTVSVVIEGQTRPVATAHPGGEASPLPETPPPPSPSSSPEEGTRLIDLAVGRSGDKGDIINVGLAARSDEAFALLREHLSADQVGAWL